MSLILNNNISALNTQRNLNNSNRMLSKSLEKLSSGFKINVAADDPSGLIISEQLRSQTSGLERAIRNSTEASNVLGITEGALIEMNEILRKLRALALHAANSGITAPDQVRADQSEVDSSIQTIDRIANATRYSDQFLLNGSKGIVFDRTTSVDDTMDHPMLDLNFTRLDQVFKRDNTALTINFSGTQTTTTTVIATGATATITVADDELEARRAYLEADGANADVQIDETVITEDQSFILTGSLGSRAYRFASGTELGTIVDSVNNLADSSGVSAQLIFDSTVAADESMTTPAAYGFGANPFARVDGTVQVYGADIDQGADNEKVANVQINAGADKEFLVGKNTDGHGRVWVKVVENPTTGNPTDLEFYKDREQTMLIGTGSGVAGAESFTPATGSGISTDALLVTLGGTNGTQNQQIDDVFTIGFVGMTMEQTGGANDGTDGMDHSGLTFTGLSDSATGKRGSILSGVDLGVNTSANGRLYFRATGAANARQIEIYKGPDFLPDDLMAQSQPVDLSGTAVNPVSVMIEEVELTDGSYSGLNATLTFDAAVTAADETGEIIFDQQGMRLYSNEYGAQEFVRLQNEEGTLFGEYTRGNSNSITLVNEGTSTQVVGGDAAISVNGTPLSADGLLANVTTQDYSGELQFNEGKLGQATVAQVGYDSGSLYSRAGALQAIPEDVETTNFTNLASGITQIYTFATNARKSSAETLDEFIGGMQFQLGGGEGDQERTVYGVPPMGAANIGKIDWNGTIYSLEDVLAGGDASLRTDPILALRVVTKAVNDVSELRARLGAFQKNTLQTNINSLEVAVLNITNTESAIRDANMASETTEFTKNQILLQAGTAMLAQANTSSQNILQLLG